MASRRRKYQVFVSHGWADRWVAQQMAKRIQEDTGASVFIDVFDVAKGDEIAVRIRAELSACNELVALLTPWSCERNWVWTEIGGAWSQGKHVVGVLYGLSLQVLESDKGGAACLRSTNLADINEFEAYLKELSKRVDSHDRK
jgi:hypothetical protein